MPLVPIDHPQDPRLEPYVRLKDRELAREGTRFLCESRRLVKRLIESDLQVESVLCDDRRVEEMQNLVAPETPLYVLSREHMAQVAGFVIHTGVLAVGKRPAPATLESILENRPDPLTLLVAPRVSDQANLGTLIRIAAGFGISALVLGPTSCDPFYRRSVRVSMGTIFRMPVYRSQDLGADLRRMKDRWGVESLATVIDPGAESLYAARRPAPPAPDRIALLIGNEVDGLSATEISWCDRRITIPMHLGTDSLNVAVATAVFCYHFCRPQPA